MAFLRASSLGSDGSASGRVEGPGVADGRGTRTAGFAEKTEYGLSLSKTWAGVSERGLTAGNPGTLGPLLRAVDSKLATNFISKQRAQEMSAE